MIQTSSLSLLSCSSVELFKRKAFEKWCGREESNFHEISPTATSTLRVYQFRHDRT